MKRSLLLPFWVCCAILPTLSVTAADFHAYARLSKDQIEAVMPSSSRTIIDLSGTWQRDHDGSISTVSLPFTEPLNGRITFRRQVRIDASSLTSHAWQLQFFGISDEVELKINGRSVQRYPGGMAPFAVRIPERTLTSGTNTIELVVTPPGEKTQLIDRYARAARRVSMGVVREVFLVGTPHVWVNEVIPFIDVKSGVANIRARTTISGSAVERLGGGSGDGLAQGKATVTVEGVITTANGNAVARTNTATITVERSRSVIADLSTSIVNPSLWSPASPNTYRLQVRVTYNGQLIDESSTTIGIRTIRVAKGANGRQVFLNDSAIFINGIEYVDDHPTLGLSMSARQMEQDVSLLKTLGVNVVRIRRSVPHPYFAHLCDIYGLMLMVELPASDIPRDLMLHEETTARLRNQAERMVSGLDHHPSIVAYGLSDGLQESSQETASLHAPLLKLIRDNGTKLVYKTVPSNIIDDVSEGGFDIIVMRCATRSDVHALDKAIRDAQRIVRSAAVLTSFGAFVSPANTNGFSDPLSNQAQAVLLRDAYKATVVAGLAGVLVWSFNDYALEYPTMLVDHTDPYAATAGLVDVWRQPRVAYSMYKSLINDEKEPLLQARDYASDTPLVFIVTGLVMGLMLVFLVNRSRRFREYAMRAILRPYNFYADIRDQRILSTVQTTILGVVIAACAGLVLASFLYYLRTSPNVEYLFHLLIPSKSLTEALRVIAWHPMLAVAAGTGFVFGIMLVLALFFRVGAMFVKGRIFMRDTLTIVVWSALPLVVLLPIGVALYQVLSTDAMSLWIPLLLVATTLWFLIRSLRAVAVVFDARPGIVYGIGFILVVGSLAAVGAMYEAKYDVLSFLQYFVAVVTA